MRCWLNVMVVVIGWFCYIIWWGIWSLSMSWRLVWCLWMVYRLKLSWICVFIMILLVIWLGWRMLMVIWLFSSGIMGLLRLWLFGYGMYWGLVRWCSMMYLVICEWWLMSWIVGWIIVMIKWIVWLKWIGWCWWMVNGVLIVMNMMYWIGVLYILMCRVVVSVCFMMLMGGW